MSCKEDVDVAQLGRDELHFRRRVVELAPAEELRVSGAAWRDAIVFVEVGEVEVACAAGDRRRFGAGAVLCVLPPVRLIRSCGREQTRLIAISRREPKKRGRRAG